MIFSVNLKLESNIAIDTPKYYTLIENLKIQFLLTSFVEIITLS